MATVEEKVNSVDEGDVGCFDKRTILRAPIENLSVISHRGKAVAVQLLEENGGRVPAVGIVAGSTAPTETVAVYLIDYISRPIGILEARGIYRSSLLGIASNRGESGFERA